MYQLSPQNYQSEMPMIFSWIPIGNNDILGISWKCIHGPQQITGYTASVIGDQSGTKPSGGVKGPVPACTTAPLHPPDTSVDFWTDFRQVWGSCEILEKKHYNFRAPWCQTNASPSCGISDTRCNFWCYNENPKANNVFIDENGCKTFWSPKIFRTEYSPTVRGFYWKF